MINLGLGLGLRVRVMDRVFGDIIIIESNCIV